MNHIWTSVDLNLKLVNLELVEKNQNRALTRVNVGLCQQVANSPNSLISLFTAFTLSPSGQRFPLRQINVTILSDIAKVCGSQYSRSFITTVKCKFIRVGSGLILVFTQPVLTYECAAGKTTYRVTSRGRPTYCTWSDSIRPSVLLLVILLGRTLINLVLVLVALWARWAIHIKNFPLNLFSSNVVPLHKPSFPFPRLDLCFLPGNAEAWGDE